MSLVISSFYIIFLITGYLYLIYIAKDALLCGFSDSLICNFTDIRKNTRFKI